MLENDAYCNDILIQSAAVNAAVNAFNKELLANHIRTCVARDIRDGKDETIDELVATFAEANEVRYQRIPNVYLPAEVRMRRAVRWYRNTVFEGGIYYGKIHQTLYADFRASNVFLHLFLALSFLLLWESGFHFVNLQP